MKRPAMILMLLVVSPLLNGCFSEQYDQKTVEELNLEAKQALSSADKAIAEVEARNKKAGLTGSEPAQPFISQSELDEQHATSFLTAAKDFQQKGQLKLAVTILNEVMEQFPETKAAAEAAGMLERIEQEFSSERQ